MSLLTPEPFPAVLAKDRMIAVPQGCTVATGYVDPDDVVLACKAPMCPAAVEAKMRLLLQNAPSQPFPCPYGYWREDKRFVVKDGRHTTRAIQLLGWSHMLVAWLVVAPGPPT